MSHYSLFIRFQTHENFRRRDASHVCDVDIGFLYSYSERFLAHLVYQPKSLHNYLSCVIIVGIVVGVIVGIIIGVGIQHRNFIFGIYMPRCPGVRYILKVLQKGLGPGRRGVFEICTTNI